jgi:maltose alpha-D-glucosyltransferase/alpha-amylase
MPESLWYKDAILYEVHVRAFYDSGADGMGDFAGLTSKLDYLQTLRDRRIHATRIRYHGDFQLGQVLHTGKDWAIVDFEGDPRRTIGQRRIKGCPLRDVASMLRSLDYAAQRCSARYPASSRGRKLP